MPLSLTLNEALHAHRGSRIGAWPVEKVPEGSFDDIGGYDVQKNLCTRLLRAAGLLQTKLGDNDYGNNPLVAALGVPRGVLLYGVSGTAKTVFATKMAAVPDVDHQPRSEFY